MEVKNSPFAHLPFIILLDGPLKCCSIFLLGGGVIDDCNIQEKWKQNFSIFLFIIFVWEGENINLSECQHLWTVETLLLKAVLRGGNAWFLRSIVIVALFDKGCILRSLTIKLNCILSSLSLISVELFTKGLKVKGGKESLFYVGSSR